MLANNNFRVTQKAQQTVLNGPEKQILYINQWAQTCIPAENMPIYAIFN